MLVENNKPENKSVFDTKIKPLLLYVGTIGAILMVIAYIAVVLVLIFGFKVKSLQKALLFAFINAVVGLIIAQFLKVQGIDFAKSLPENKTIMDEYIKSRIKEKKLHSITYYWVKSVLTDIVTKGLTVALTTTGIIYIVIEGSNDYSMILLAIVNLLMFICFGLLALVKAYDYYNEMHIPYILQKIENNKINNLEDKNDNSKQCTTEEPRRASIEE